MSKKMNQAGIERDEIDEAMDFVFMEQLVQLLSVLEAIINTVEHHVFERYSLSRSRAKRDARLHEILDGEELVDVHQLATQRVIRGMQRDSQVDV
eukprot:CAMPEP_0170185864 /NCGR_PEP_ID=MMETSP0040_2-20121228/37672_1 /TAXON_ID=641309 /ORGANISM="Lotharella oceanica, Strain CCMP622" /LENGTH=94 /DNA_ID=CAMNT_0010432407 /DNA_START=320 /DNA_END=605 /DNA_ORIENTATION=+